MHGSPVAIPAAVTLPPAAKPTLQHMLLAIDTQDPREPLLPVRGGSVGRGDIEQLRERLRGERASQERREADVDQSAPARELLKHKLISKQRSATSDVSPTNMYVIV